MKALVVGLGSIGERHIRNLKLISPGIRIAVLRQHAKTACAGQLQPLINRVFSKTNDAAAWNPDITLITNPASLHVRTALIFAKAGSHILIEKPFASSLRGIPELMCECRKKNLVLMIGYCLRFFRPIQILKQAVDNGCIGRLISIHARVGQYLPDWRPQKDFRSGVSAQSGLGGGAVLELSHELDYLNWIAGEAKEVTAKIGRLGDWDIDVEDIAEAVIIFKNRAIGSVHMDMLDRAANRSCRIIGTKGTLVWDMEQGNCVRLYSSRTGAWRELFSGRQLERNDVFIKELKHFIRCARYGKKPLVDPTAGLRALKLALAVKRSAKEGRSVRL
ncbi:MAG: Gfo/Idh/MocA family oxidoreductase [Candidatus Omnitrophota bacterium]